MKYKHQAVIDEFAIFWEREIDGVMKQAGIGGNTLGYTKRHLIRDIVWKFFDEQLSKKEEEVLRKFVSFCKHWIRGHKKDDWHPILMDSFEAFLENRKEEFTNWEFEETVRTVELKTQK